MRKLIDLITEGAYDSPPTLASGNESIDFVGEIEKYFQELNGKLKARRQVEDVYLLVLDGIPFEDAVGHIAGRTGMDPLDLRAACVDDYRIMRSRAETYNTLSGRELVHALNPIIRESIESYLDANPQLDPC